jgi:amino acid adenylation domain-containing protein
MHSLAPAGTMVALEVSESELRRELGDAPVSIAAVNAQRACVISGPDHEVSRIAEQVARYGIKTKRVPVVQAFHSSMMDGVLPEFSRVAAEVTYRTPRFPILSNVSGTLAGDELASAAYWTRQIRATVRFADGVRWLADQGVQRFIELGPRATLLPMIAKDVPAAELLPLFSPAKNELESVGFVLAAHHVAGAALDWQQVFPGPRGRVALPTYGWQRDPYWPDARPAGSEEQGAFHGIRLAAPGPRSTHETILSSTRPAWLADHRVGGEVVVPAAAILELFHAACTPRADEGCEFFRVVFQAPIVLRGDSGRRVHVVYDESSSRLHLFSQPLGAAADDWELHASAERRGVTPRTEVRDLAALRAACTTPIATEDAYARLEAAKLDYAGVFRSLRDIALGPSQVFARVELPDERDSERHRLHPALLDAAFQLAVLAEPSPGRTPRVPFELDSFGVLRSGVRDAWIHASSTGQDTHDVVLLDDAGLVLAEARGLCLRAFTHLGARKRAAEQLHRVRWIEREHGTPLSAGRVLVLDDATGELVAGLRRTGIASEHAHSEALESVETVAGFQHVVVSCGGDDPIALTTRLLPITQRLAEQSVQLWLITRGAVCVNPLLGHEACIAAAAIWGFGRTLSQELTRLRCRLLDIDPDEHDVASVLARELTCAELHSEAAWYAGRRYVPRLEPVLTPALPDSENYQLQTTNHGTLDGLALAPAPLPELASGQLRIAVRASGLNFKDVLTALGEYPGAPEPLGGECSGIVVAIGDGVRRFAVGDCVMALGRGSFSRFVVVEEGFASHLPASVALEEAGALPIAFLTAWYSLIEVARLKPGERVLINAAAGGVGLAAVQIARMRGAEIFATASPGKWPVLRALGIEHLASSRDLSFRNAFASAGIDVVVNALTGEFVDASLSLLRDGGRFIELGKRDLRDPAEVRRIHGDVQYRALDLMELSEEQICAMFAQLRAAFERGNLTALPTRMVDIREAERGFRQLAQGRTVGKLALTSVREPRKEVALITGGLGGVGRHVARWCAQLGMRHIALLSRRGAQSPDAERTIAELHALGSSVSVAAVDVCDRAALSELIRTLPGPLRIVVHAAAVLDDGLVRDQTPERIARAMAAKVQGAWNLHEVTQAHDVDRFVLFSSVAGTFGSSGQSAYAAANAHLDALAAFRRARGLPTWSLAWGPWSDVGLARSLDANHRRRWEQRGFGFIDPAEAFSLLDLALSQSDAQLVVAPLELDTLRRSLSEPIPSLWRSLIRGSDRARPARTGARDLGALLPSERARALEEIVRSEIARVLSLPNDASVAQARPVQELGLDSLMAIELQKGLERRLGVQLKSNFAFDHPTPAGMVSALMGALASGASAGLGAPASDVVELEPESAPRHEWRLSELSPCQERLWFVDRAAPELPLYNMHFALCISGMLDAGRIERAFRLLANRHDALRTSFVQLQRSGPDGELPRALIAPECAVPFRAVDLRGGASAKQLNELAFAHRTQRFDLERGPLWAAAFVTLNDATQVLLFTCHHIIMDGLSVASLFDELAESYRNDRALTRTSPLVPYSEFAHGEQAYRATAQYREDLAWWKTRLDDLPKLELSNRVAVHPSHRGDAIRVEVPSQTSRRARRLAAAEGCTLFTLLLSAWAAVLARYSGQLDFGIATLVSSRDSGPFENVVGFFINTVVLRCNLSGSIGFRELIQRSRQTLSDALARKRVDFADIVRELAPARTGELNPLIQASFDFPPALPRLELPEAKCTWSADNTRADGGVDGTSKFSLGLALVDDPEGIRGTLEYASDLFTRSLPESLAKSFIVLLEAALADPDKAIDSLPLMSDVARRTILYDWNGTAREHPPVSCLPELFAARASATPHALAVSDDTRDLTYREIDARTNRLAHVLWQRGVGRGTIAALYLPRSVDVWVGALAILKAGAAYLPLDTAYPPERLAYMLADSKVRRIVTTPELAARLAQRDIEFESIDIQVASDPAWSDLPLTIPADVHDPAYVMYTSGSTGRPKAVVASHKGTLNRLRWMWERYPFADGEVLCQKTSLNFVDSVWELFGGLLAGIPTVMASDAAQSQLDLLVALVERKRVSRLVLVPGVLRVLLERADLAARLGSVKHWTVSGDVLSAELATSHRRAFPDATLLNLYGSSEVAGDVTYHEVGELPSAEVVPIGRPIDNTQVYVLDERLEPVSPGLAGDLYAAGDNLALGYGADEERTQRSFVPNPFSDAPSRMYCTGDRARWTGEGVLEYVGRRDRQVKISGVRIELDEIEAALRTAPPVRDAAVVAAGALDKKLVAYVVAPGSSAAELRAHLERQLPAAFRPSQIVLLSELPTLPSGKVDRRSLETRLSLVAPEPRAVEPATVLEKTLVSIWQELLAVDHVNPAASFFDQGGTSLQLVRMQGRIARQLGKLVSIGDLFAHPTIESLARSLSAGDTEPRARPRAAPAPAVPESTEDVRRALERKLAQYGGGE